jgi:putative transcriptional regulator
MATGPPLQSNLTHHFLICHCRAWRDEALRKRDLRIASTAGRALGLIVSKASDINVKGLFDKVDLPYAARTDDNACVSRGGRCRPGAASSA